MHTETTSNSIGISVLVVEPSRTGCALFVEALTKSGYFERVVGTGSISAAKQAAQVETTSVALIARDIEEGNEGACDLIRYLGTQPRPIRSLVMAKEWNPRAVIEAFTYGAKGVFTGSEEDVPLLCKALVCVHMGQVWANSEQLNHTLDYLAGTVGVEVSTAEPFSALSSREKEIAELLARGATNKEIARTLYISERTVKNHLANIFKKINVSSRIQAVLRLMRAV